MKAKHTSTTSGGKFKEGFDQLKFDQHRKEAFIYSSRHGYERPLGSKPMYKEKIQFPKMQKGKSDEKEDIIYKKGETFYDENGEFLYRVPGL